MFGRGKLSIQRHDTNLLNKESFVRNETEANKSLAKGCVAAALALLVIWIMYLAGVFGVNGHTLLLVNIIFPVNISFFTSSIIFTKTTMVVKPWFKYYLLFQFIIGMFILNCVLPKHTILGYALCIILATNYYSPKVTRIVFISVAILSLISLYGGMFIGEWDANLMNGAGTVCIDGDWIKVDDTTPEQRFIYLHQLLESGDNRYQKALLFYYLPRLAFLSLCFLASVILSRRSLNLTIQESQVAIANEKFSSELNIASNLQTSVLPKEFPSNDFIDLYATMNPAKEVGGDFYDFFMVDEKHLAIVIADVSGKGVPAALFMMKADTLIKSLFLTMKNDVAGILKRVNHGLCENNDLNMFVTCWLGLLHVQTGKLKFANAGHNAPLLLHNGSFEYVHSNSGLVLGAVDQGKYREEVIHLVKGDKLFLYTDGVTEAHNLNNQLYGEVQLRDFLNTNTKKPVNELTDAVLQDLIRHANGKEQFDDVTILALEFRNSKYNEDAFEIDASLGELEGLIARADDTLLRAGFTYKEVDSLNLAMEEVFVNIANYAYPPGTTGKTWVSIDEYDRRVIIKFRDNGKRFDPLKKKDPNINAAAEDRDIGGLGIFMVKKIMDDVRYEYTNNQNVLTLIKNK